MVISSPHPWRLSREYDKSILKKTYIQLEIHWITATLDGSIPTAFAYYDDLPSYGYKWQPF
jgi:hypothetical protein